MSFLLLTAVIAAPINNSQNCLDTYFVVGFVRSSLTPTYEVSPVTALCCARENANLLLLLFLTFCGSRPGAQGLMHARQVFSSDTAYP